MSEILKKDFNMFLSASRLTLGSVWIEEGMENIYGTADVFVRDLPKNRNYLVFAGSEEVIDYLLNLKFDKKQLDFFRKSYNFTKRTLNFYKKIRFSGDLYAMPEGTIFFPGEPVIRITASLVELQLIEQFIINAVMSNTMFASKLARFETACQGIINGLAIQRSHGIDAVMKCIRAGIIVGLDKFPLALASMEYKFPAEGGMSTHAFITSFPSEIEAFRAYSKYFPEKSMFLLDTYDVKSGINSFIKVAKEVESKGKKLRAVVLDSGDIVKDSKKVRKLLEKNNLEYIEIVVMGNIDEFKIDKLIKAGAQIDMIAGGTELVTCADEPKLEVVFKLSEIIKNNKIYPKMKLTKGKVSFPGKKQVYRNSLSGKYNSDIIGLEREKIKGTPLLKKYIKEGKLIKNILDVKEVRNYHIRERNKFNKSLLDINKKVYYKVKISNSLKSLTERVRKNIIKNL